MPVPAHHQRTQYRIMKNEHKPNCPTNSKLLKEETFATQTIFEMICVQDNNKDVKAAIEYKKKTSMTI